MPPGSTRITTSTPTAEGSRAHGPENVLRAPSSTTAPAMAPTELPTPPTTAEMKTLRPCSGANVVAT